MTTMTSINIGVDAQNVGEGLPAGHYEGQIIIEDFTYRKDTHPNDDLAALVSYGRVPGPADDAFVIMHLERFEFEAGMMDRPGVEFCWVRSLDPDTTVRVVRRRVFPNT